MVQSFQYGKKSAAHSASTWRKALSQNRQSLQMQDCAWATNPLRRALDQAQCAGVPVALLPPVPAYHGGAGPTQRVR